MSPKIFLRVSEDRRVSIHIKVAIFASYSRHEISQLFRITTEASISLTEI